MKKLILLGSIFILALNGNIFAQEKEQQEKQDKNVNSPTVKQDKNQEVNPVTNSRSEGKPAESEKKYPSNVQKEQQVKPVINPNIGSDGKPIESKNTNSPSVQKEQQVKPVINPNIGSDGKPIESKNTNPPDVKKEDQVKPVINPNIGSDGKPIESKKTNPSDAQNEQQGTSIKPVQDDKGKK